MFRRIIMLILQTILIILIGIFLYNLIFQFQNKDNENAFKNSRLIELQKNWEDKDGNTVNLKKLSPNMAKKQLNKMKIFSRLPETVSDRDFLMFQSSNLYFTIRIDGIQVRSFKKKPAKFVGHSYGDVFHFIELKDEYAGKKIEIEVFKIYNNSGGLKLMFCGDSGFYTNKTVRYLIFPFFASCLAVVIGIFFFVMPFGSMALDKTTKRGLRALSGSVVIAGLWSGSEVPFLQLLIGHSDFFRAVVYPMIIINPLFVIIAVNYLVSKPSKKIHPMMLSLVIIEIIVCKILNLTLGYDLHQCQFILHSMLLFSFFVVVYLMIKNLIYCQKNKIKVKATTILSGFFILIFSMLTELIIYYFLGPDFDVAITTSVGAIIMVQFMFIQIFKQIALRMKRAAEIELYQKLAYNDSLTKLGNRAAFEEMKEKIINDKNSSDDNGLLLVCVDLDN